VYRFDRGVTRTLIEKGINAALIPHGAAVRGNDWVARVIQDHYDVLEGLLDLVAGQRHLTSGYVKELHAALLRNQDTYTVVDQFGRTFERPLEKGAYKTSPNSPTRQDGTVHEYCPPEHVASEMDQLIRWFEARTIQDLPCEVQAAWLHHRFTQIHPFADGNGRVARALASLLFIKAGWFPVIVRREDRTRYVESLESADAGDLRPLVQMFVEAQRQSLIQASDLAYEVRPATTTQEAAVAIRERLQQRGLLPLEEWLAARSTADRLVQAAVVRFREVVRELRQEIGALDQTFHFGVPGPTQPDPSPDRLAAIHPDVPDFAGYNALPRIMLATVKLAALALSFHGVGPRFRGLIAVVPFLTLSGTGTRLPTDSFLINYEEPAEDAEARFAPWLEKGIVAGLNAWRQTL
jgi:fido (protein-threonine AMPylation protein)